MKTRINQTVPVLLCLSALVMTTAGFRACSAEEKRSTEARVAGGLDTAARAIPAGVETVRAFRVAGKIEPATSLKLARTALDLNSAAARVTTAALDGADAETLAGQLDALITLARGLQADGTLHIKNEGTRLVFDLSVIAAKNGLEVALRDLKRDGSRFTLEPETREKLSGLKPVFEENDRLLREAVARLSSP